MHIRVVVVEDIPEPVYVESIETLYVPANYITTIYVMTWTQYETAIRLYDENTFIVLHSDIKGVIAMSRYDLKDGDIPATAEIRVEGYE